MASASDTYQESNPLECKICRNPYNEDHCPRILSCSHDFCRCCIGELILTQKKHCPVCRAVFTADSAEDFMINRGLLDAAKQFPSMHMEPKAPSEGLSKGPSEGLSKGPSEGLSKGLSEGLSKGLSEGLSKAPSEGLSKGLPLARPKKSIQEFTNDFHERVIKKGMAVCQETEAEVKGLTESHKKMRGAFAGLVQTLGEMKLASDKTLSCIDQNEKILMGKMEAVQAHFNKMRDSDAKLRAAVDFASAGPILDEAEEVLQDTESDGKEVKSLLQENKRQNNGNIKDTLKMKINLENQLETIESMIEEEEGEEEEQQQHVQEQETEQEEEEGGQEEERETVVKITATDLQILHGWLRGDPQGGVFALMTFEGKLRLAPVKIESNNQVSFTHLEEGVLPPRCFVIELESLIPGGGSPSPPLSPPPPRGFLDLAYGPTPLGRVIIRVTVDGFKGRNFLLMCAGGMGGVSYAHSGVSGVGIKGIPGEWIRMGQYVSHGGGGGGGGGGTTSTRAVLPSREEDWKRERESGTYEWTPWKAGDVRGNIISYEGASEFWIVTRDGNPSWIFSYCFGMVEEGLDVLKSAISKYEDIEQVQVANCGLIL